jgi:hypothetical protein
VTATVRRPLLLGATALAALVFAAPGQASFAGSATDPEGDATDGHAAHDIVGFGALHSPGSGTLTGVIQLAGASADGGDSVQAGISVARRTPDGCPAYPAVGLASVIRTGGPSVRWSWMAGAAPSSSDDDGYGRRETLENGRLLRFEVSDDRLKEGRFDCVLAWTNHSRTPETQIDVTSVTPMTAQAELTATLRGVPKRQKAGQRRTVRLVLHNPGHARTGKIRISVGKQRGLSVRHARTVSPLGPGARRSVRVTTSLSPRSTSPTTTLRVTASAGSLKTRAEGVLRRTGSAGGSGGSHTPQLCNRWLPDITGNSGGSLTLVPC